MLQHKHLWDMTTTPEVIVALESHIVIEYGILYGGI